MDNISMAPEKKLILALFRPKPVISATLHSRSLQLGLQIVLLVLDNNELSIFNEKSI